MGPRRFKFLNVEAALEENEWDPAHLPKLWRYLLHYFDDLNAFDADGRAGWHIDSIREWISANPVGQGTGWEPYPISLRIINWIKWLIRGNAPPSGMLESLTTQAEYLSRTLEFRLLGNHLFANLCGLVFAGMFFEGRRAGQWLTTGLRMLDEQLAEQILPDGGHFELSPMYQASLLVNVLDLINAGGVYRTAVAAPVVTMWRSYAARMIRWLEAMSHPDGEIAFFNDSAFGVAPPIDELRKYCAALGIAVPGMQASELACRHLEKSGFVCFASRKATLIFDAGHVGPDYQPGHGHADTLSFELSYAKNRVFVNSGTSTYERGELRSYQRATAAHNSVVVDGYDQSEVWAAFRVARRARPLKVAVHAEDGRWEACAAHDGYLRLSDPILHRRTIKFERERFKILDELEGGGVHEVDAYLHLHPEMVITTHPGGFFVVPRSGGPAVAVLVDGKMSAIIEDSIWYPRFGVSEQSKRIRLNWFGNCPVTFETTVSFQ
jgi:uncharacterized heparinase superfamily protein